jgi:hypothetical protein
VPSRWSGTGSTVRFKDPGGRASNAETLGKQAPSLLRLLAS